MHCLGALKQILAQKSKTLHNPIKKLEIVLLKHDDYSGKAVVLRQLVYGECASDGRTMAWLDQYFGLTNTLGVNTRQRS
jgi:archaellum biogenesis ATPase FlaH